MLEPSYGRLGLLLATLVFYQKVLPADDYLDIDTGLVGDWESHLPYYRCETQLHGLGILDLDYYYLQRCE